MPATRKASDTILFSGGAPGAEAEFGACAEKYGVEEVNFTFDGHRIERLRGVRVLNHEELLTGDVSLDYVSRLMNRRYTDSPALRKVLQTLWYQVNHGQEIYVIGAIQDDRTVRGGTGWGAEFAKLCNKPSTCSTRTGTDGSTGTAMHGSRRTTRTLRRSRTPISRERGPGRFAATGKQRSRRCSSDPLGRARVAWRRGRAFC